MATRSVRVRLEAWRRLIVVAVLFVLLLVPIVASSEIELTLSNAFIETYKNRATINVTYIVDKAHEKPNPPSKDGDLHVAGRADAVGLPIVAEIMNAKLETSAVDLIHQVEGTGRPIQLSGAWRLWTEHGGNSQQVQGRPLTAFTTTNPDHVFQIHPITKVNDLSLFESFVPIEGYQAKDAHQAFVTYENIRCEIRPNVQKKTTTLITTMGGFNYVEFVMELNEDPVQVPDGRMVMAGVHDVEGELLVRNRRMVFIAGTPPERAVSSLKKGDRLHALAMPRIDLALVSWRVRNAQSRPGDLRWNLPYEMLIVGVYPE